MNLIIKRACDGESITLDDAFKDFVESRNLKDKTIHDYGLSMNNAFKGWKRKRLLDITRNNEATVGRKVYFPREPIRVKRF